jgi:hypothetical protein
MPLDKEGVEGEELWEHLPITGGREVKAPDSPEAQAITTTRVDESNSREGVDGEGEPKAKGEPKASAE